MISISSLDKYEKLFSLEQLAAIGKLSNGKVLMGGVGSGKSRTALGYYMEKEEPKDLYVITTARKRDTNDWEKEASPFGLNFVVDSWNNIMKYSHIRESFFIFDEQRVVGSGVWVKSFLKIAQKNNWILLSATPGDTWMDYIPVFVANGFYKSRTEFIQRHVIYKPYRNYPVVDRYVENRRLQNLRNEVLVIMDYVKHTVPHFLTITVPYDKVLYDVVLNKRWNPFTEAPIQNVSEYCQAQRKVVNADSGRLDALFSLYEKHKKLVVFYNFDYELEMMRKFLEEREITFAEWNGHLHQLVPTSEEWVYLVQYTAGAEGWECTTTDTIVLYSQNYSYKTTTQAFGRIDRRNTPYTDLYFYHLRSLSPIDMRIYKCYRNKEDFNESRNFEL